MKNIFIFLTIVVVLFLWAGCSIPPSSLIGTWETETVETEWGPMILEYTFQKDFTLLCSARSTDTDEEKEVAPAQIGQFKINDKELLIVIGKPKDVIRGKLKGSTLFIWSDDEPEPIRFHKKGLSPTSALSGTPKAAPLRSATSGNRLAQTFATMS